MDPATEPAAFRRYKGAALLPLDEPPPDEETVPFRPLDRGLVSRLFFDSLAVSAWVGEGAGRYSLRVAPSAGNLHPIESYLIAGPVPGLFPRPALYHYSPFDHGLEVRRELPAWDGDAVFLGLTAIVWRTAWKYGERAFRLVHLDAGHAIAAVSIAAAAQGWTARRVEIADADLADLLGVSDQAGIDGERPVCLLALTPGEGEVRVPETGAGPLLGRPTRVTRIPPASPGAPEGLPAGSLDGLEGWQDPGVPRERRVLRARRSRSDFDGSRPLPQSLFRRLLDGLPPTPLRVEALVQNVEGLAPERCLAAGAAGASFVVAFRGEPRLELLWQAGILGHRLYLEAEAAGLAATGLAPREPDELYLVAVGIRRSA